MEFRVSSPLAISKQLRRRLFFDYLKGINWTSCSFIKWGQILIFIGAIQIETGRVQSKEGNPTSDSPARLLADCLSLFRTALESKLDELAPT